MPGACAFTTFRMFITDRDNAKTPNRAEQPATYKLSSVRFWKAPAQSSRPHLKGRSGTAGSEESSVRRATHGTVTEPARVDPSNGLRSTRERTSIRCDQRSPPTPPRQAVRAHARRDIQPKRKRRLVLGVTREK